MRNKCGYPWRMWDKYRKQFAYAADIEYERIMQVLHTLMK